MKAGDLHIKPERKAGLIKSIARGRAWLEELVTGAATGIEQIAIHNKCSIRHVNMTISMAFIAADLVKAAIEAACPVPSARPICATHRPSGRTN